MGAGVGGAAPLPCQHGQEKRVLGGNYVYHPLEHFQGGGGEKVVEALGCRQGVLALIPVENSRGGMPGGGGLAVHKSLHTTLVRGAQPILTLHASGWG